MSDGLILDGPVKGHHIRCTHLDYIEIPKDYGIKIEPIFFTARKHPLSPPALEEFKIILYKKVWLERGTVYAWILR